MLSEKFHKYNKINFLYQLQNYKAIEQITIPLLKDKILVKILDTKIVNYISVTENSYDALIAYESLLHILPDNETIYKNISTLLKDAPESFPISKRNKYLQNLDSIPKINKKFLLENELKVALLNNK